MPKGIAKNQELKSKKISEAKLKNPTRYWLGKKRSKKTKLKISKANIGCKHPPRTKEYIEKLRKRMIGNKLGIGKHIGEKCNFWKGGITPKNRLIRSSLDHRLWREAVFKRDNYTCQKYGIKGGVLHPHHIKNFSQYPELRFAIDNGITLSEKAHKEFHKIYGQKNNTEDQLKEYLL
jgi:hypothetical protein